jgi:hypothetical protein
MNGVKIFASFFCRLDEEVAVVSYNKTCDSPFLSLIFSPRMGDELDIK